MMKLAKPAMDIGLMTADGPAVTAFWRDAVGLKLDHVLPVQKGHDQHRFDLDGSVLKVNVVQAVPAAPPSGYRELIIASDAVTEPRALTDPDGTAVRLVPRGWKGVGQMGVRLGVRDLAAHRRFFGEALGLPEAGEDMFGVGNSLILLEQDPDAPDNAGISGTGWRYLTVQIFDCEAIHAEVLARGGREGAPPRRMGDTARFSMVRDPDGNWIELSQRASLTGPLD